MSKFFYRNYKNENVYPQIKSNWSNFELWRKKLKEEIGEGKKLTKYATFGCKLGALNGWIPHTPLLEHQFIIMYFNKGQNDKDSSFLSLEHQRYGYVACLSKDEERIKKDPADKERLEINPIHSKEVSKTISGQEFIDRLSLEKKNMNPVWEIYKNCQHYCNRVEKCIKYDLNKPRPVASFTSDKYSIALLKYFDIDIAKKRFQGAKSKAKKSQCPGLHIVGTSGSGKTYLAHYIMYGKAMKDEPFLYVDISRKLYFDKNTFADYLDVKDQISIMIMDELDDYVRPEQERPFNQLKEYLKNTHIYIILDGIDHLLERSEDLVILFDKKFGIQHGATFSRKKFTDAENTKEFIKYYELEGYSTDAFKGRINKLIEDKDIKRKLIEDIKRTSSEENTTHDGYKSLYNIEVLHNIIDDEKMLRYNSKYTSEYTSSISLHEYKRYKIEEIYQRKYKDLKMIVYKILIQLVALMTLSWKDISVQKILAFYKTCYDKFYFHKLTINLFPLGPSFDVIVKGLKLLHKSSLITKNHIDYTVKSTLCWSVLSAENYDDLTFDELRVAFVYYYFRRVTQYNSSYKGIKYNELKNQVKQAILMSVRKTIFSSINLEIEELRSIMTIIIHSGENSFFLNLKQLLTCPYENYFNLFTEYLEEIKVEYEISQCNGSCDMQDTYSVTTTDEFRSRTYILYHIIEKFARPNLHKILQKGIQEFTRKNRLPNRADEIFKEKNLEKKLSKILDRYEYHEVYPICNTCKCQKHIPDIHFAECKECEEIQKSCSCGDLHTNTKEYDMELLFKLVPIFVKWCASEEGFMDYIADVHHLFKELRQISEVKLQRESEGEWEKREYYYETKSKGIMKLTGLF